MSKEKITKAEKKAAKAEAKALKAAKKAAKADKMAAKAAKKAGKVPAAPVTKKAAVFGHPVRNLLLAAIISIVLGVVFIVPQIQTMVYSYICYAIGGLVALVGIIYIILYFARKPVSGEYHYEFGCGFVAILAGAYIALSNMLLPNSVLQFDFNLIVKIIGILIALDGILKLQYMLDLGRMGFKRWWILLITSILGIALGVVMVGFLDLIYTTVYSMGYTPMLVLGAAYCLNGLLDIISMIVVAVRNRKANKAAALAEAEEKVAAVAAEPVEEIVIEIPAEEEIKVEVIDEPVIEPVVEEAPVEVEMAEPAQAEPAAE